MFHLSTIPSVLALLGSIAALGPGSGFADTCTASVVGTNPDGGGIRRKNVATSLGQQTFPLSQISFLREDFAPNGPYSLLAIGDFNGDGILDVALGSVQNATISVWLNDGSGSFTHETDISVGARYLGTLTTGDFNEDGKLDLAFTNTNVSQTTGAVSIILGNGDGSFGSPIDFTTMLYPGPVTAADFDADGHVDLAVAGWDRMSPVGQSPMASIFLGKGDGTFGPAINYPITSPPPPFEAGGIVACDFNLDGTLDLAVADYGTGLFGGPPYAVSVLLGNGDGSFTPKPDLPTGTNPTWLAAGDFDNDGIPDLAVANLNSRTISILLGNGDGRFRSTLSIPTQGFPWTVVVGDFNNDGNLDLAIGESALMYPNPGTIAVLLGNGDGSFAAAVSIEAPTVPESLAAGDFNGDGKLDLVLGNNGVAPGASLFLNTSQ